MNANTRNTSPFTASQRQEFEHHALIFKYMVSGVPIPSDLIYTVKRSMDSSLSSTLFAQQPKVGWGRFQMSFGRKVDPEPGRCRRTDGKKWRCSKEAYPESKYCERHMHRGRNRSRKPVEITSTKSTTETTNLSPSSISQFSGNLFPAAASSRARNIMTTMDPEFQTQNTHLYPLRQPPSSSFRPPGSGLFLEAASYSETDTDHRHLQGMREGLDEQAFFPLTMNSYRDCSQSQFQSLTDHLKQKQQEPHCFMLGNNLKSARPINLEKENETKQQPLRQFFGEWTPKSSDSWLDLASNSTLDTDD